jgi:hypothetical protein
LIGRVERLKETKRSVIIVYQFALSMPMKVLVQKGSTTYSLIKAVQPMEYKQNEHVGKKVFFLNPPSVIKDKMIKMIFNKEYEVYPLYDHRKTAELLKQFNEAILFVNIDDMLPEPGWEKYIRDLMANVETKDVQIGIVSYNEDKTLAEKYLLDVGVQCGYIRLKLGLNESMRIILKVLEANEARGRRRYVRTSFTGKFPASFNVKMGYDFETGTILDLSSAGMACAFNKPFEIKIGTVLNDIQISFKGIICNVSGTVAGVRKTESAIILIMFYKDMDSVARSKISEIIYSCQQREIEEMFANL